MNINKQLTKSDLNIVELNLTTPLWYGNLASFRKNYVVDFDVYLPTKGVNLQRGFVWSLHQKQQLIFSVFKQRYGSYNGLRLIPHLSAVRIDNRNFQIIDGKQRLSTLFSFMDNEFYIEHECVNYYYKDLSKELQHAISGFNVEMSIKYHYEDEPVTDEDKINWFEMINFFGTPQELSHLKSLK